MSRAFAQANVAVLVGDWTGGDAAVGRFRRSQGRSGDPLHIHYAPGKAPEILPQLLAMAVGDGGANQSVKAENSVSLKK